MAVRGIDRAALCAATGKPRQTVTRWLSGDRTPGAADLHALLAALDADDATRLRCLRVAA
jgi:transcriptional regulator with XRE-family HTH domain